MPAPLHTPLLTDDAEAALWSVLRETGSVAARERLFSVHANFARNIARRHFHEQSWGDLDLHDLYQMAYAGLLEAVDRFDPKMGAPFRPFAAHRISGSIRDGITRMNEMREQISWRRRVKRERIQSLSDGSTEAQTAIDKLAELVVGLAIGFMLEGTGLYLEVDRPTDSGLPSRTAYDTLVWKEMVDALKQQLQDLPERERCVLQRHYVDGMSFSDVAKLLRISKGRVSQLHHSALELLRKRMSGNGHFRLGNLTG